jgi:hypothetical protein
VICRSPASRRLPPSACLPGPQCEPGHVGTHRLLGAACPLCRHQPAVRIDLALEALQGGPACRSGSSGAVGRLRRRRVDCQPRPQRPLSRGERFAAPPLGHAPPRRCLRPRLVACPATTRQRSGLRHATGASWPSHRQARAHRRPRAGCARRRRCRRSAVPRARRERLRRPPRPRGRGVRALGRQRETPHRSPVGLGVPLSVHGDRTAKPPGREGEQLLGYEPSWTPRPPPP